MRLLFDHSCLMGITVLGSRNIWRSLGGRFCGAWFPEETMDGLRGVKRIFEISLRVGELECGTVLLL